MLLAHAKAKPYENGCLKPAIVYVVAIYWERRPPLHTYTTSSMAPEVEASQTSACWASLKQNSLLSLS